MSLAEIRQWFDVLKRRRKLGEAVPSVTEVANRAGMSRQTVYALLRNERSQFGATAQIRLSRVIRQISSELSATPTRLMTISMATGGPRLHLGTSRRI